MTPEERDRILDHVASRSETNHETGCREWVRGLVAGYGQLGYRNKLWRAHRLVWTALYGAPPAGTDIAHLCHNKKCVHPAHLACMTHRENMQTSISVGAMAKKLNARKVQLIRALLASKSPSVPQAHFNRIVGQQFGVSRVTISHICAGRTWPGVGLTSEKQNG